MYATIRDISRDGISVAGIAPFQVGEEVAIRIEGHHRGADLVARSRVVWSRQEDPSTMGMGAEFLEITAGRQLLDHILTPSE